MKPGPRHSYKWRGPGFVILFLTHSLQQVHIIHPNGLLLRCLSLKNAFEIVTGRRNALGRLIHVI